MGFLNRNARYLLYVCVALMCHMHVKADIQEDFQYERPSLSMMLVKHHANQFTNEIEYVFSRMKTPERFNNHDLGVRLVGFATTKKQQESIESFIRQEDIGKRCIAKWFNRNKKTGLMNMDLIRERGLYNANANDYELARNQMRGLALLEDAGELLIDNTYLIFNDITYVDQSIGWGIFKDAMNVTKGMADIWLHNPTVDSNDNPFENPELSSFNGLVEDIKGFRVKITSYLFKLDWNAEDADKFYSVYYTDESDNDPNKKSAFKTAKNIFPMTFVGMVQNTSTKASMSGVVTNEQLITKVCTRAVDKNIADLQKKIPAFRIKAPIVSVAPIRAAIGMKEDVSESSKFEVLERSIDKNGKVKYKRVGVVKPKKGKIADNRFMAKDEGSASSVLDYTEFEIVSGSSDLYPGLFLREI